MYEHCLDEQYSEKRALYLKHLTDRIQETLDSNRTKEGVPTNNPLYKQEVKRTLVETGRRN